MPIAANVQLPMETKDPREAVTECIRLVRNNAVGLKATQIHLGLISAADCGVLTVLAERLPAAALGFCIMGSDRALTAGQFSAGQVHGLSTFDGMLTEHLLPADAFVLVERLLQSSARSMRSTAFNLRVLNIRWKGAPSDGTGSLDLCDFKGFNRSKRFSLCASLQVLAEDPKSREVKDMFKQVAHATGIPFNEGRISRVLGEEGSSLAYGRALLIGQVCLEETIEDLADKLPKNWISEFAPNALAHSDAFAQRMQQWGTSSNHRINLPSLLKNAVRQDLPEFKFVQAEGDRIYFSKAIHSNAEAVLLFEKEMPRMGKAFTLALAACRSEI